MNTGGGGARKHETDAWLNTLFELIPLLDKEVLKTEVLSLALSKGDVEGVVGSRTICVRILGALAPRLTWEEIERSFFKKALSMCQDVDHHIRIASCGQLAAIARIASRDVVAKTILPELFELLNDEEIQAREASLTTLTSILEMLPPEVRKGQVMPILRNHMQPLELDIEMQRCLARVFGQLVTVLREQPVAESSAASRRASHAAASTSRGEPRDAPRGASRPGSSRQVDAQRGVQRSGPPGEAQRGPRHTGLLQLDWSRAPPLPAGVNRPDFCKRLMAPPRDDTLPRMDALVVVEGFNDCLALHRAVRAPVFVLGGGYAVAEEMRPELRYLVALAAEGLLPRRLVVFTDPDWQGRNFRTYLDDLFRPSQAAAGGKAAGGGQPGRAAAAGAAGLHLRLIKGVDGAAGAAAVAGRNRPPPAEVVVRHAFLRVELGTSADSNRNHEAGNVGVEHATPDAVRTCLRRARPGFGVGRTEFSLEELRAAGLVGSWDDKALVAGPQLRRSRFCAALGIDVVGTGKALLNLLNRFFSREDYEMALRQAVAGDAEAAAGEAEGPAAAEAGGPAGGEVTE
ncbi:Serine/threonine-protein phosphatase 4 regulatory subunit 4 [Tetrabaena socialis]|uniref:Serine/threonine-protein phosphatase 4 regulatory subunit 4 n=1 Tax=Tetrabaena socialis TaxID=47790 RepID=A0A2J8AEC1_9CHLO|nr:Serine/threonine-protein phosphatase 4 regulatory subunit 4 [Tetrabaena socialis]|eukprot:PNH10870.1 Serine/threonine-protein phosphatase 4 regulatory subunit 4 [Tetrabaena socialis]